MRFLYTLLCAALCCNISVASAQLLINEGCNRNGSVIADEDGDFEDWIELYNAGVTSVDMSGYALTDTLAMPFKWLLPGTTVNAGDYVFLFASGKDRKPAMVINHWEQPVDASVLWRYQIPTSNIPGWNLPGFNDAAWSTGNSSIGYGDADDAVVVPAGTTTVYMRYTFDIADTALLEQGLFSIDYDDGFIAYLNGNVIAMNGFAAANPAYNEFSGIDHEAAMYTGGVPENFVISKDSLAAWLVNGENTFAVEVHNVTAGSSDLTARPFLSFGILVPDILWSDVLPWWFTLTPTSENYHTNFMIDGDGELIYLIAPDGSIADSMLVHVEFADQSIGRISDGAPETGIFTTPTPNAANSGTTYTGYTTGDVAFSLPAGFYSGDQTLAITIPAGTVGHYTLNGEIPTLIDPVYTLPLTITENTVVRVRLFDAADALLPGKTFTNTYFIDENITVPVISLSTDVANIYGPAGIFDNWWTDWKRLCHIEYFDAAGINAFEQASGFKVDGGAGGSRYYDQKSMRIEPDNSAFGEGEIEYPLIPRRPYIDEYETFYLRNGSNMYNVLPYKDAFMMRTTEGTYNEFMAYTPVVVFINGEYWGLYELRNKLDDGHFENTKGIEKDSLDLASVSFWYGLVLRAVDGSLDDFIAMRDFLGNYPTPEDSSFYFIADSILNLQNFTDYIIAETWFGNLDWPYNNIKAWQDRGGDGRWNYAIIDAELALGIGGWSDASVNLIPGLFATQQYIEPLAKLLQNPIYHDYFVNRYADLMNTTFLPERTLAMEDSMYMEVIPEMPRQLERWGWGTVDEGLANFETYRDALRNDFDIRTTNVRNHINSGFGLDGKVTITLDVYPPEAGYIQISTIFIDDMPWSGVYFEGVPVQVTAYPNPGYTFDHWYTNPFIDDEYASTFKENITANTTFTASFVGSPVDVDVTIGEINYHTEPSVDGGNWIELWNNSTIAVDISGWNFKDGEWLHNFIIPEGTILPADARLVLVEDSGLFQAQYPDVTNYIGNLNFGLANFGEEIYLIDNRGELRVHFTYGDDQPWPVGADGHGRTLERRLPLQPIELPTSWFDGCIGGSPGVAYSPCAGPIVFSEINYHSNDDLNSGDWVELRNISDDAVDIGGWTFMDDSSGIGYTFQIPEGTWIEPHAHRVLVQDADLFSAIHPSVVNADTAFHFNLSEGGEWIRMYDAAGILQLSVDYFDMAPWSSVADGAGYTLELVDSAGIMNDGDNWTSVCYGGSPDAYIAVPCSGTVDIAGFNDALAFTLQPNPTNDIAYMTMQFAENATVTCTITDLTGTMHSVFPPTTYASGTYVIPVNMESFAAGVYLVTLTSGYGSAIMPLLKQ